MTTDEPFFIADVSHCAKQYNKWKYYLPNIKSYYSVKSNENDFKTRTLRVSSAPKQPYNRRSIDINRLDGFSRPTSSFIHRAKSK